MIKTFLEQFLPTIPSGAKLMFVSSDDWQKLRVAAANPLTFPGIFDECEARIVIRGCRIVMTNARQGFVAYTLNSVVDIVASSYRIEIMEADGLYYAIRDNWAHAHSMTAHQTMQYLADVGNYS